MQKRKALDSGSQSEQKKHMTEKGDNIEYIVDATPSDTSILMESSMNIKTSTVFQGCTANETSSLSEFSDKESLKIINNDTVAYNSIMPSDETENCTLIEENGATKNTADDGSNSDNAQKVLEASSISAEGNTKALSLECREHPSPIRGVIHDTSSNESIQKNLLCISKKGEACFSFQTTDKIITGDSSEDQSKNPCSALKSIGDLNIMASNIERGSTNGLENKVESISMNLIEEDGVISDLLNHEDKRLDAIDLDPERLMSGSRRKKLLVLDINGILADIVVDIHKVHRERKKVGGKVVFIRPFCEDFIKFCFEKFDIGIWSSRRKYNVDNVLDHIMGDSRHKLLFCWDQAHCTYTGFKALDNVHKPLVLKELKKIWNKEETELPWEKGDYSPSNTLLIDDSPYKALCNPPHTAIFPEPYQFDNENDTSLGPEGDIRLYLEGLCEADDVQHYVQQHPFGQQAITSNDASWCFYSQVIEKVEQSLASMQ